MRPVAGSTEIVGKDPQQNQEAFAEDGASRPISIKSSDMLSKIARDLNFTSAANVNERRQALQKLHLLLFTEFSMSTTGYNEVFRDTCKTLFKRYSDPSEKCRELSLRITLSFFERATDFVPILAYFFPMLLQSLPCGLAYDEEMKVFVTDIETHEAYKRGKAVERQDKTGGATGALVHNVVEESEELRNLSCKVLGMLLRRSIALGASSILHPYFHEIIMFLQMQLKDPFPDLRAEACASLEVLARTEEFNSGMKFFAVALVRATLPVLRHRHAKVRLAAVRCVNSCIVVPDRAKVKGSGTDAIADLVGFREENVLQVSAFYKADVQINYLAELVRDNSVAVKESLVCLLGELMTEIGDRYDHQTRLLPYLLDLLTDESDSVSSSALTVLRRCGQQYEEEHPDEVIEKRQYGIDGDDTMNLQKPLPKPFLERPRIGIRLYVRGNCKRFLAALINELTNWVSATRVKSAKLLKIVVALSEEHLTMEVHTLLPSLIKALRFANDDGEKDKDKELYYILLEVFDLLGRYISPSAYLHYMLPRLRADAAVSSFGADMVTRVVVIEALQAMVEGSKPSQIIPFLSELIATLTDPFVIDPDSPRLTTAAVRLVIAVLTSAQGRGQATVEAQYVATGRLSTLRLTTAKLFTFLLTIISNPQKIQKVLKPVKVQKKEATSAKKISSLSVASILSLSSCDSKKKKTKTKTIIPGIKRNESSELSKICSSINAISPTQSTPSLAPCAIVKEVFSLHSLAVQGLKLLVCLESGVGLSSSVSGDADGMKSLVMKHGLPLLSSLISSCRGDKPDALPSAVVSTDITDPTHQVGDGNNSDYPEKCRESNGCGGISAMDDRDLRLLICLVSSPWGIPLSSPTTLSRILDLTVTSAKSAFLHGDAKEMDDLLAVCSELLLSVLVPFCYVVYPVTATQIEVFTKELFDSSRALSATAKHCLSVPSVDGEGIAHKGAQGCDHDGLDSNVSNLMGLTAGTGLRPPQGVDHWAGYLSGERLDTGVDVSVGSTSRVNDSWMQSAVISDIISDHVEDILETFVLSPVWGRSAVLQGRRIEVLSMLAGYTGGSASTRFQFAIPVQSSMGYFLRQCSALKDPVIPDIDSREMNCCSSGEGNAKGTSKSRNRTIFPLVKREFHAKKVPHPHSHHHHHHLSEYECASTCTATALIKTHACDFFSALSFCLDPNKRVESRMGAVELAGHFLRLLCGQLPDIATSRTRHNEVRGTLLSYAARDKLRLQSKDESPEDDFYEAYNSVCEAARGGISLVLGALSDGSDAVCLAALEVLQIAAPLILQHEVKNCSVTDEREEVDIAVVHPTSFVGVLNRLLLEIITASNSTTATSTLTSDATRELSALDVIDSLLRCLAPLDPETFVSTVRIAVDRYLGNSFIPGSVPSSPEGTEMFDLGSAARDPPNPETLSVLSGLLDHGDFLIILANR